MAFTQAQLDDLEKAIATGLRRVQYEDRVEVYHSLEEMERLRDRMRRDLGLLPQPPRRKYASHAKGLGHTSKPGDWEKGA